VAVAKTAKAVVVDNFITNVWMCKYVWGGIG